MPYKTKLLIQEAIYLLLIAGLVIGGLMYFLPLSLLKDTVDIPLNDTYLTLQTWKLVLPSWTLATYIIYGIKEWRHGYSRLIPNIIITVTGIFNIIVLTILYAFSGVPLGGWSAYPPLLAVKIQPQYLNMDNNNNYILLGQFFIIVSMFYFMYHWGKNNQNNTPYRK